MGLAWACAYKCSKFIYYREIEWLCNILYNCDSSCLCQIFKNITVRKFCDTFLVCYCLIWELLLCLVCPCTWLLTRSSTISFSSKDVFNFMAFYSNNSYSRFVKWSFPSFIVKQIDMPYKRCAIIVHVFV